MLKGASLVAGLVALLALAACGGASGEAAPASSSQSAAASASAAPAEGDLPADCYNSLTHEPLICVVPTPRAQHIHVAVMDNDGGSAWSDDQIVASIQTAAAYWLKSLPGFLTAMDVVEVKHYTSALVEQHLAAGIGCGIATGASGPLPAGWSDAGTVNGPAPEAAAEFPGVDFTWAKEDVLVVVLPSTCRGPSGELLGEVGAQNPVDRSGPGNSIVWEVGVGAPGVQDIADFNTREMAHELGHVLGLAHVDTGWCENASPSCGNARDNNRPDPTNIMGVGTYGLLTTAQRSLFGLVGADELETLELPDGADTVTQQYTIASLDQASGLRSVKVVLPWTDNPSDPFDQPTAYWLNYLPQLSAGAVPADHAGEIQQRSGLLVQHFIVGFNGHGMWNDLLSENADHSTEQFHLFQPGETYANWDGSVSVHVDAMDPAAGLTLTVTLTRP